MTVENPPGIVNDVSTGAKIHRHAVQAQAGHRVGSFSGGIGAVGMAHGISTPDSLQVTQQGSPTMGVTVTAGLALITGTASAEQGPYSFYNDAPVNLTISAAHATQTRYDLIIAQIRDDDYSGANTDARLFVVPGTPSGSPADPSLASYPNALVLARVTVAGAASSITNANITDLRLGARASAWYQKWGVVGYAQVTATQTPITTVVDLTGLTVTWNAIAGRRYRIEGFANGSSTVPGDAMRLIIADGSSNQIQIGTIGAAASAATAVSAVVVEASLSGSTTRKLRFARQAGTGTLTLQAGSTNPAFILVEDIGPA